MTETALPAPMFSDSQALRQAVLGAVEHGYSFAPNMIGRELGKGLAQEATRLSFEADNSGEQPLQTGTTRQVRQRIDRAYLPIPDERIPLTTSFTEDLAKYITQERFTYPPLHRWMATEAGFQRYAAGTHEISAHRDRKSDQLLAVTITILGSAVIRIYEALDDPNDYSNLQQVDEFKTKPGSMMFLRAPGLGNDEQTIHAALPPKRGSRLVLNLRMRPDILKSPGETSPS